MEIRRKTLTYKPAQEHILRRLGGAIVVHWDDLPDELQDLLIDQAAAIDDAEGPAPTRESVETFVRSVKAKDTPREV